MTIKNLEIIERIGDVITYIEKPIKVGTWDGPLLTEPFSANTPIDLNQPTTLTLRNGWTIIPKMDNIRPIRDTQNIIVGQGRFEISALIRHEDNYSFATMITIRGQNLNSSE